MARRKEVTSAIPGTVDKPAAGYPQCEWEADGDRCRYPGTLSNCLRGEGPFYCSAHFGCSSPLGADIVKASRDYVHKLPGTPRYDRLPLKSREPGEDEGELAA